MLSSLGLCSTTRAIPSFYHIHAHAYDTNKQPTNSFVVVSVLRDRYRTPALKKTVNPTWAPKDATFDFPLYLSLADKLGVIELVIWDKDTFTKEYLGEVAIPLDEWFRDDRPFGFDDPDNTVRASSSSFILQFVCSLWRRRSR